MLTLFRRIRRSLIDSSSAKKYAVYAIGEILLVMVGILLALQVNNWNEERKNKKIEYKLYESLQSDLRGDSTELVRIILRVNRGLEAQKALIVNSYDSLKAKYTTNEIEGLVQSVTSVGISFFPRSSTYDQITSSGLFNVLKSEEIKKKIVELYKRDFELYKHVDEVVEQKTQFHLHPVTSGKLRAFRSSLNIKPHDGFDMVKFKNHYDELVLECSSSYWISATSLNVLKAIQEKVNDLIVLIRQELDVYE